MKKLVKIFATFLLVLSFQGIASAQSSEKVMQIVVVFNGSESNDAAKIRPFVDDYVRMLQAITLENSQKQQPDPRLKLFDPEVQIVGGTCNGVRMYVYVNVVAGPEDLGEAPVKTKETVTKSIVRVGGNILLDQLGKVTGRGQELGRRELENYTEIRPAHVIWFREEIEIVWKQVTNCEEVGTLASIDKVAYDFEVYRVGEFRNGQEVRAHSYWKSGGDISIVGIDPEDNYRPTQYVIIGKERVLYANPNGPEPLSNADDIYGRSSSIAAALMLTKVMKPINTKIWK